jgi:hypothetical protein
MIETKFENIVLIAGVDGLICDEFFFAYTGVDFSIKWRRLRKMSVMQLSAL